VFGYASNLYAVILFSVEVKFLSIFVAPKRPVMIPQGNEK